MRLHNRGNKRRPLSAGGSSVLPSVFAEWATWAVSQSCEKVGQTRVHGPRTKTRLSKMKLVSEMQPILHISKSKLPRHGLEVIRIDPIAAQLQQHGVDSIASKDGPLRRVPESRLDGFRCGGMDE